MRAPTRKNRSVGPFVLILVLVVVLVLGSGCATTAGARSQTRSTPSAVPTTSGAGQPSGLTPFTITVPETDLFTPYIAVIAAGTPIRWVNADTVLHTVISGPTAAGGTINPVSFQLALPPGDQQTLTLRAPGLYYYYCGAHATIGADGRAASMSNTRAYPLAMDGFLEVVGSGLSGSPAATIALTAAGTFAPWMTVVNRGASITWTNPTAQAITLVTTPGHGTLNPVPLAVQVPPGGSATQRLSAPGIYDYYSTQAATLDKTWNRPIARSGAPGYPAPMEGIIVVLSP